MQQRRSQPALVFCAAAEEDASLLKQWEKHLLPLEQAGYLVVWSGHHLLPGEDRIRRMNERLNQANLIVLLLSPDFFVSSECTALMEQALKRHRNENVCVISLLLRPSTWCDSPLVALPYMPSNGREITGWRNRDKAFQACLDDIRPWLGLSPASRQTRAAGLLKLKRTRMLGRLQRAYEVMLETSLRDAVRIELDFAEKADAVSSPAHLLLQNGTQNERLLPLGTPICQAYDDAEQELLILGAPGTGKSSLLVELAFHLVTRAEQDEQQPLPVIVPLSSWVVKRLPLEIWLSEQISQIYGISSKLSYQWVQEHQFLPMLDGLDEVDERARPACIAAINTYHREHMYPLVVCSRQLDYSEVAAVHGRLTLQNAIVVQPLTEKQIDAYLRQVGKPLAALRSELKKNQALRSLAAIPLWLNVMTLAYRDTPVRHLSSKRTKLQQQVMQDYVQRVIEHKGDKKRYPSANTIRWLSWLARAMRKHNQSVFFTEEPRVLVDRICVSRQHKHNNINQGKSSFQVFLWPFYG